MAEFIETSEHEHSQDELMRKDTPPYPRWASTIGGLVQRRKSFESRWKKLYSDYRGEQALWGNADESIIVNVTFGDTKVIESVLYYQDPYFRIRPSRDPNLAARAALLEELVNTYWYKLKIGMQCRQCIVDAAVTGIGWMLVGFSDYHDPNIYHRGSLYVKRVSPLDLYTEDDLASFDEATFFVRRGLYSVRWLQKIFGRGLKWTADTDSDIFSRRGVIGRKSTQATIYEVVDLVDNKLFWLSPQHKKIIYTSQYPYEYMKDFPYVPLYFAPDPERLLPISLNGVAEGQQEELNKIRTQQMIHRKRYNRRYLAQQNTIDDDELKKIEAGEDGVIAFCKGDPSRVMKPIEDAPLDTASTQLYQQDIKSDRRELLGINEYLRAGFIPRTKSAQEASMIQQGSNIRTQNLSSYAEGFYAGIARKMVAVMQNDFDSIQELSVMRAAGQFDIRRWTKEDIAGDFDIEIDVGSSLPPQPLPYEMLGQMTQQGGQVAPGEPMGQLQQAPGPGQGGGGESGGE